MSAVPEVLPGLTKSQIANVEVLINGQPLAPFAKAHLARVTVEKDTVLPSMFELILTASPQQASATAWIDDQQLFDVGREVRISMGYGDALENVITGEITGLEPAFIYNGLPTLTVRGYDRRHRLQRGRKTRSFVQQKDSAIAEQIAREAGLSVQAEDTRVTHPFVFQANQTDLGFLQERARLIHYEVVVKNRTLLFRPVGNDASSTITLSFMDHLLEFHPRLSTMGQISEIEVRSWNLQEKQAFVGRAGRGNEGSTMGGRESGAALQARAFGAAVEVMSRRPAFAQAEVDQRATASLNHRVLDLVAGEGTALGRTDLDAGQVIEISDIGVRFSGRYYTTSVKHQYTQHNYLTHFTVRRNAV